MLQPSGTAALHAHEDLSSHLGDSGQKLYIFLDFDSTLHPPWSGAPYHPGMRQPSGNIGALRTAGHSLLHIYGGVLQLVRPHHCKEVLCTLAHFGGQPAAAQVPDGLHKAIAQAAGRSWICQRELLRPASQVNCHQQSIRATRQAHCPLLRQRQRQLLRPVTAAKPLGQLDHICHGRRLAANAAKCLPVWLHAHPQVAKALCRRQHSSRVAVQMWSMQVSTAWSGC